MSKFVGLTVGLPEKIHFEQTFGHPEHAEIHFASKHDTRNYDKIVGPFDVIVDVNLKSFACCEQHFQDMMALYVDHLAPDGVIITAATGLRFGWSTAKRLANTPGVSVGEAARSWRILGEQGVQQLGERYGLALEKHAVRGVAHWHGQFDLSGEPEIADESLCCFAKADWFEAALHVISVRRRFFHGALKANVMLDPDRGSFFIVTGLVDKTHRRRKPSAASRLTKGTAAIATSFKDSGFMCG